MTRCTHDPVALRGQPIGMYHCPNCACMVLAGMTHAACEPECSMQDDADRALWEEAEAMLAEET